MITSSKWRGGALAAGLALVAIPHGALARPSDDRDGNHRMQREVGQEGAGPATARPAEPAPRLDGPRGGQDGARANWRPPGGEMRAPQAAPDQARRPGGENGGPRWSSDGGVRPGVDQPPRWRGGGSGLNTGAPIASEAARREIRDRDARQNAMRDAESRREPDWQRNRNLQGDRNWQAGRDGDRWRGNDNDRWRGNDNDRWRGNDNDRWRSNGGRYAGNDSWNRQWRSNSRYDWRGYRDLNRGRYRFGTYYAPYRGWSYRRLNVGFFLQPLFFGSSFWINDPYSYRLPPVYGPYRWVRYYDDALLVNIYTGEVVDTIYDIFW